MEEERHEPVKTSPTPLPFTDRSSDEESDVKEEAEESEHQKNSDNTARIHVCEHCGRQFSSGKALGGHKRIHFQSSKRDPARKKTNCRKIDDVIHGSSCSICGKIFRSVKALYGHLRLHPDRPWRGAANNQNQSASPLRYNQSNPKPNPNPNPKPKPKPKPKPNPSSSIEPKLRDLNTVNLSNEENPKKRRLIDPDSKKRKLLHGNGGDDEIRVCSSKEKKKVFICYPCNKSFSSHQAYGGHVSSHNKSGFKTGNGSRSDPLSRARVLDIDLNEIPPMEDDDDDEGQCRSQ